MWCVSEQELDNFVFQVSELHRAGLIPNDINPATGLTNPYHDNLEYGPNMYAVTKYVIQPLTLQAGGMSWALMQHPQGLQIDFFVTHGWAEGIYEFYAKAKRCWQTGKNGWICFLALPQPWSHTEDFKGVIGSNPDMSDAPFVRALEAQSCTRMLVVPNATQSIYKRLWCIEEAPVP
jgi:hypothetical protein